MNIVGCIAEFNPFHQGHRIYLEKAKKLSQAHATIVVMSGNFVQRGEPAIIDVERRTQCALSYGADLVLELHPAFALSSAEFFASGAVKTLLATGLVTDLVFGSESGQINDFYQIQDLFSKQTVNIQQARSQFMKMGYSYSSAMAEVLKLQIKMDNPDFQFDPNNILGLEYVKAASQLEPQLRLHTYRRIGAGYHEDTLTGTLESASAIRNHLKTNKALTPSMVPEVSLNQIIDFHQTYGVYASLNRFFRLLQYRISLSTAEQLHAIYGGDEGLENLLLKKILLVDSYEALVSAMTSKRYPASRIRRYLMAILLDYTKSDAAGFHSKGPSYLKPLGFNTKGQSLLKRMKEEATLPVLSNMASALHQSKKPFGLDFDLRATDLYWLALPKETRLGAGIRQKPKRDD